MGHTFGLPHLSGPYSFVCDNPCDVMSADRYPCNAHNQYDDTHGCVGQQTIGRHKAMLGWLAKLDWFRRGGEASERQWRDVLGVMKAQSSGLDVAYLRQMAGELRVEDLLVRALEEPEQDTPFA